MVGRKFQKLKKVFEETVTKNKKQIVINLFFILLDADNKKEKTVDKNINTNQTVEKKANKKKVAFASAATSSKKEEENHSSNHNGNSQTNGKMNGHSEKKEKVESKSKSTAVISKYWKPSSVLITVLIAAIYYFISSQD